MALRIQSNTPTSGPASAASFGVGLATGDGGAGAIAQGLRQVAGATGQWSATLAKKKDASETLQAAKGFTNWEIDLKESLKEAGDLDKVGDHAGAEALYAEIDAKFNIKNEKTFKHIDHEDYRGDNGELSDKKKEAYYSNVRGSFYDNYTSAMDNHETRKLATQSREFIKTEEARLDFRNLNESSLSQVGTQIKTYAKATSEAQSPGVVEGMKQVLSKRAENNISILHDKALESGDTETINAFHDTWTKAIGESEWLSDPIKDSLLSRIDPKEGTKEYTEKEEKIIRATLSSATAALEAPINDIQAPWSLVTEEDRIARMLERHPKDKNLQATHEIVKARIQLEDTEILDKVLSHPNISSNLFLALENRLPMFKSMTPQNQSLLMSNVSTEVMRRQTLLKNGRYQEYVETTNPPLKNILASGGQIYQEFLQGEGGGNRGFDNWVADYDKAAAEAVKKNPDLMDPEDMNPLVSPMIASVARALSGNPQASEGLETAQAIIRETVFYDPDRMRLWAQTNMNSADQQKQSAAIMISLSETFGTSGRALFDAQFFTEDFQKINKGADKESASPQELLYNDVMSEFLAKDSDFKESLPNANRVIQYFARVNGEAGIIEALGSYVKKAILTGDTLDKEDLLKDVENLASGFGRYAEVGRQGFFIPSDKDSPRVGSWWRALRPDVIKQSTLDSRAEAATSWMLNSGNNKNTLNFYEFSKTDASYSDTAGDIRTAKNLNENYRRGMTQEDVTKKMIEDGSLVPLFLRDKTGRDFVVFKYRENRKLNTWKFVRPANGGPPIRSSAAAFYRLLHVPRINSSFESSLESYDNSPNSILPF